MTKFTAYYNLCSIHDTNEFLGSSPDHDASNIIATLGRNIAIVIKISTQKQIRSWSVLEKFSTKVVFDRRSQQYVGVFASKFIRLWDSDVSDVNKSKKLKFKKSIGDLVYDPVEALVVYADGTCESLSSALEMRKKYEEDTDLFTEIAPINPIIDPNISVLETGRKYFTYFQKTDSGVLTLFKVELDTNRLKPLGEVSKFNIRRGAQDVNAVGYSVIEVEKSLALLSIWSDRRVFLFNLTDKVDSNNSPGQFVSMFTELRVDLPLTILALSKHSVAIYGGNSTQEGGSLILYNTQFKVVKAKQFFKIYFNFSRLWSVGSTILLAMGQNLSVVSYQMSKELLADLVGSQISHDFSQSTETEFVNEEEELEEHLLLDEVPKLVQKNKPHGKSKEQQTIFADGKVIPFVNVEKFDNDFQRLMNHNIRVEINQIDSAYEDIELNLMQNSFDNGFLVEEVQIIARELEECGASEHEITEKLLWILMKADLVEEIAACLRRYTHISERILVKTMKYVLQDFEINHTKPQSETDSAHLCNGNHMDVDVDVTDSTDFPTQDLLENIQTNKCKIVRERKDLMTIILSCSFDVDTIAPHIQKELTFDEVVKMLDYLHTLISSTELCLEERLDYTDELDDELRILRWFGVFLNTHFQKMTLSKDLNLCNILLKWSEVFDKFGKQIPLLESLAAQLYNVVAKKSFSKSRSSSKWYSVEVIDFF